MDYVMANFKLPKEWFNASVDLPATVGAFVSIKDDTWEINVRYINFPGWYVFNLKPEFKRDLYDFVEQKCMDKYIADKEKIAEPEYNNHD
jgi:hypothetical protein